MNKNIITFALFLIGWYYICYISFIEKDYTNHGSPQLRARLGTILWHSSDGGGEEHLYCYYPKAAATYPNKGGEYIIKRVEKMDDCRDWFGMVVFHEAAWVSEKEKIWWSKQQKIGEDLVSNNVPNFNI